MLSSIGILLGQPGQLGGVGNLWYSNTTPIDSVGDFWRRGKSPWEKALLGKVSVEVCRGREKDKGYACHGSCLRPEFFLQYVAPGILAKTGDLINTQKYSALS